MKTCLLIDGTDNPISVRVSDQEVSYPFMRWGRAGQSPLQFRFVRAEGPGKEIYVFRLHDDNLTDEEFEASATLKVDEILNPRKYRRIERENEARRTQAAA